MHMFHAVAECHRRFNAAAEALAEELDAGQPSPRLLRARLDMAIAARENLAATQRLWARIELELPDIATRLPCYDRLRAAESALHVRYSKHIAAWPISAITSDFRAFAIAKRQFLRDMHRHMQALEIEFYKPASLILTTGTGRYPRAA